MHSLTLTKACLKFGLATAALRISLPCCPFAKSINCARAPRTGNHSHFLLCSIFICWMRQVVITLLGLLSTIVSCHTLPFPTADSHNAQCTMLIYIYFCLFLHNVFFFARCSRVAVSCSLLEHNVGHDTIERHENDCVEASKKLASARPWHRNAIFINILLSTRMPTVWKTNR